MNRLLFAAICGLSSLTTLGYSRAGDRIATSWGENINSDSVWQQYPRPIMERVEWENLNGLWDYAIVDASATAPDKYDGEILVPFPVESSLSGVGKEVGENKALWYKRTFSVPSEWEGKDILLNFGAVDWQCDVWVNDVKVGGHEGGYTPFSLNITPALASGGTNTLTVRVYDPTDCSYQPHGKQVSKPSGIWYTPVTGIWQTVWLEPVSPLHISSLRILPDIDANTLSIDLTPSYITPDQTVEIKVFDNGQLVASGRGEDGETVTVNMPEEVKLWSPDAPNLYDMEVSLYYDGALSDKVNSYAAMRKFSTKRDDKGKMRIQLNNKDLFQYGPLDQGWWPDGLYTPPSYEAMIYDIDKTKDLGFNMIRKHIKVEPATWYTYCDRAGIIVWQDMPSGDKGPEWQNHRYFDGTEMERSPESEATYRKEWKEIIDCLYNYPSICTWIPFNEAWGQFKTCEIAEWTKSYDPSRLVNPASGGNFYKCGDILDLHNYPGPAMYLYDDDRVNVLGEFGGIGYVVDDHIWNPDRNWGYIQFKNSKDVTDEYVKYVNEVRDLVDDGFSAAVYTQTTDVEVEVNGLMTYDRKVVKMDEERVRKANTELCSSLEK